MLDSREPSSNINFAHNTILFRGTAKEATLLQLPTNATNVVVTQNILQNEAGGYVYSINGKDAIDAIKFLRTMPIQLVKYLPHTVQLNMQTLTIGRLLLKKQTATTIRLNS